MQLNPHLQKRVDRIHKEISLFKVLEDYGYAVQATYDREQQFPCDLHGDGRDGKPSARAYPDSESWWCFACARQRDAIATCQEKEGKPFVEAIRILEKRYNLPYLEVEWSTSDEGVEEIKSPWPEVQKRAAALLMSISNERLLSMKASIASWEFYDKLSYQVKEGTVSELDASNALESLRTKLMGKLSDG